MLAIIFIDLCAVIFWIVHFSFIIASALGGVSQQNGTKVMSLGSIEQGHRWCRRHIEEVVSAELQLACDTLDLFPGLKLMVDGLQVAETDEGKLHRPVRLVSSINFLLEIGNLFWSFVGRPDELDDVQALARVFIKMVVQVVINKVRRVKRALFSRPQSIQTGHQLWLGVKHRIEIFGNLLLIISQIEVVRCEKVSIDTGLEKFQHSFAWLFLLLALIELVLIDG